MDGIDSEKFSSSSTKSYKKQSLPWQLQWSFMGKNFSQESEIKSNALSLFCEEYERKNIILTDSAFSPYLWQALIIHQN